LKYYANLSHTEAHSIQITIFLKHRWLQRRMGFQIYIIYIHICI